ncbi:MAG: cyclic nucleotide-binding domain-containing protein, partial [Myxococcales bacterium]
MSTSRPASRETRHEAALTPALLREIGLFGALSDEVLDHLVLSLKTVHVHAGDTVFREGDPAREMYVLLEGEMEVTKRSRRGHETRVAILGPLDTFGEMALIDMQNRSATVRALAPSRILCVTAEDLNGLYRFDLKAYALIVLNIARDMSRRLRVTDGLLADFAASVLDEWGA